MILKANLRKKTLRDLAKLSMQSEAGITSQAKLNKVLKANEYETTVKKI